MWLGVHISVDGPMQVHASSVLAFLLQDIKAALLVMFVCLLEFVHNLTFCEETRVPHCRWSCSAEFDFLRRNFCSAHVFYQVLHQGAPTGCKRQNDQIDWRQVYLKPTSTFFDINIRQIEHYFVHFEHYKWNDSLLVCFKDLRHVLQSFGTMFVRSCVR